MTDVKEQMASMFGDDDSDDEDSRREVVVEAVARAKAVQNDAKPYAIVAKVAVGGGRGLIATQDIPAGTLIVSEIPVMSFEDATQMDDPALLMRAIKSICEDDLAIDACAFMYPQNYDDADKEEIDRVRGIWGEEELSILSKEVNVPIHELIRRVLAVQHNGFNTGIYKWLAMINHSCQPNCIKFAPNNSSNWGSEIWTTCAVKKGEELTWCYQTPLEMTRSTLQNFLTIHHRFTCACALCSGRTKVEKGDDAIAAATSVFKEATDNTTDTTDTMNSNTENIESNLTKIEEEIIGMELEQKWAAVDDTEDVIRTSAKMFKVCVNLQARCLESLSTASDTSKGNEGTIPTTTTTPVLYAISSDAFTYPSLNLLDTTTWAMHRSALMMLARVHKLFVTSTFIVLEHANKLQISSSIKRIRLKTRKTAHSFLNYIVNSFKLRELQNSYLGIDHIDLATTNIDIAEGIDGVLDLYASSTTCTISTTGSIILDPSENTLETLPQFLQALQLAQVSYLKSSTNTTITTGKALQRVGQDHRAEGTRIKELYRTRRKFPEAYQVLNQRGAVYWGKPPTC